ncbi:Carbohydrate kinase [Carbonactinospora thermoautotrophica]|uniref:Bifunctional NAD(P)H-hydrate repair enzyme n=2 Tax=Carbonactinospora thermoautotrophica TaxID=1469144 RepID=A0A132MXU0_9ACTN|nr:bifunctional ADP-dependent NAD(P)H-hydrate dehydratase/NAD(P)H-hydrate epimerase [Carbonactinospora thermoautotrophica]KWX02663.1 Carbohydrate kinase [Carbonactinospora thermoautotrophica]
MRNAYHVEHVRAAEAALMARLPEGTLMQRAAAGLAATCARLLGGVYGRRVVLLVGSGDNGGDALYAGARLARRGARVDAILLNPERAHAGGLAALRAAGGRMTGDPAVIDAADLVVDGITGIGGQGGLRPGAAELAARAAGAQALVVAVDVPSGVDASTGVVEGPAVRADVTVTFGTYKPGLLVDPGASHAGVVELVDIGLGPYLPAEPTVAALQAGDVARLLPELSAETDKYRRGVVGVVAGSDRFPGAAVLTVGGALYGAAGYVRLAAPRRVIDLVLQRWPETVCSEARPGEAGRVQAWVVGPGMGTDEVARDRLAEVLASDVPVLVDADGLTLLGKYFGGRADRSAPTVLTPHAGECARLLGAERADVEARRLEHTRQLAERTGATVLLKGSTTLVADPAGAVRVNPTGTPWLGTAGTGDVLSGLIGSLLAAGLPALDAASVGAYLHGLAGRLAADDAPIAAHDVIDHLPAAWRSVGNDHGPVRDARPCL